MPRADADLAAILYTSGTTGRSKGAMLTHANLWSNAEVLRTAWRYGAGDVLLHALPIFHIHGLFVAINLTLAAGASLRLLPRFDADAVFAALPGCNVMMGVPTFYVRLLQDKRLTKAATRHVRLFVSGSAPLLADTHREWRERTGHAILERYGMTETGMNASNPYEGERVAGTVGPPLPGVEIRITDPASGALLPAGEMGMIEVRGPNVFAGYWRNPEKTREEFRADGFFITGDLGRFDSRGYLRIVGRGKDLIISGGFNVYPKEVEEELDALPGVAESAVIGLPHPDFGEGVTAVMVAPRRPADLTEAAVLARLRERLAAYKCPKRVLFVDDLPRNTMGKVQKNLLRDTYRDLYTVQEAAAHEVDQFSQRHADIVPGVWLGERVLDLAAAARAAGTRADLGSMLAIIRGGEPALDEVRACVARAGDFPVRAAAARRHRALLAPLPALVRNAFCVGRNYVDHVKEGAAVAGAAPALPTVPQFFTKATHALNAPNGDVRLDAR